MRALCIGEQARVVAVRFDFATSGPDRLLVLEESPAHEAPVDGATIGGHTTFVMSMASGT